MPWKRPDNVPLGQVWKRFKGRDINGPPARMYQIRDLREKDKLQVLEHMKKTFLRDEPISKCLDVLSDPESVQTIHKNWAKYLSQNVSLGCFTEVGGEPEELVAFNIICVRTRDEEEEDVERVKGEKWKQLLKTLVAAESLVNVFDHFNVDIFLSSSGLAVFPEHRGQNIGARILEAREPLCKALGISVSCTVYTAIPSQVLAKKCGFEVLATLKFEDMLKEGVDLRKCSTKSAELAAIKYDFN